LGQAFDVAEEIFGAQEEADAGFDVPGEAQLVGQGAGGVEGGVAV
jgi:hypothetical protein